MLFTTGKFGSPDWLATSRSRTIGTINDDIAAFLDWFNTDVAASTNHPVIEADPHGAITGRRLRRTLAWHIVRRPGSTIAGATQYGHLFTQITHGYAGQADAGFLDEITFEEFLLRSERLHDDHRRLARGEHISGPAADTYRHRVAAASQFHGLTITTAAQANTALANPDLQVHHGALLTCVWRPETAACQDHTTAEDRTRPCLAALPVDLFQHRLHRPRHHRAAPPRRATECRPGHTRLARATPPTNHRPARRTPTRDHQPQRQPQRQ